MGMGVILYVHILLGILTRDLLKKERKKTQRTLGVKPRLSVRRQKCFSRVCAVSTQTENERS